ncbi:expansin family protein [Pholiota molesta]|nr:expansin family protein [Pholiota molesta]
MSFARSLVLLLAFAVASNALTTPHVVRHPAHHHALAARVAAPAPLDIPANPLRKRQNTKRCRQRSSSLLPLLLPASHPPRTSSGGGSNLPSFLVGTQTGQGTFYATGLGACGITNTDTDHIAAVSHLLFDNFPGYNGVNPNENPLCGRTITATYQGKSVTVALTDRCTGCALTDLDFSPSAFNEIADFAVGRISGMTWVWNS